MRVALGDYALRVPRSLAVFGDGFLSLERERLRCRFGDRDLDFDRCRFSQQEVTRLRPKNKTTGMILIRFNF